MATPTSIWRDTWGASSSASWRRCRPRGAYAYLGPVTYESHTGDRPIAITWRLAHPMPAALFDRYATLASG
jgi:hypothetical protein